MKVVHLHATQDIPEISFDPSGLPKKVGLVSTIQMIPALEKIKEYLSSRNVEAVVAGQVLGCDQNVALKVQKEVDAFLFVGSGEFHPIGVLVKTGKNCFTWKPGNDKIQKVNPEKLEKIKKRKQGMLAKFYSSEIIGVLISTKSGQKDVQSSLPGIWKLRKEYPDKQFYFFAVDTFNMNSLEDFNYIQCWINCQCPRIREDLGVLNIEDLRRA